MEGNSADVGGWEPNKMKTKIMKTKTCHASHVKKVATKKCPEDWIAEGMDHWILLGAEGWCLVSTFLYEGARFAILCYVISLIILYYII